MPHLNTITCPAGVWTELTTADVTALRLQILGGHSVAIMATANAAEPSNTAGAIHLHPGDILAANMDLADIFPGVSAGYRVWAMADRDTSVSVSHA